MERPEGINYTSAEWLGVVNALKEMVAQLDVVNRDMTLDYQQTQNNRAMQAAYTTIIGWGKTNRIEPQQTPPYALGDLGDAYDPTKPHPDDDPVT